MTVRGYKDGTPVNKMKGDPIRVEMVVIMLKEVKRAVIREMIRQGVAEDITHASGRQVEDLNAAEGSFNEILWSRGVYGCNGLLLKGRKSGRLYAITERTGVLFGINSI